MLTKIRSTKNLPYKLYIATLLKNDTDMSKFDDLEGYYVITRSPKMTIMFLEYQEGQSHKVSKEIWNRVQYISKVKKIEEN